MTKNEKLSYDFFYFFSRFEFALKNTGFLNSNNNVVMADWDKFAELTEKEKKLSDIDSTQFKKTINYFFENPPQKQFINNVGVLDWKNSKPVNHNWIELITLIRRVRNNFFHGGKFCNGPIIGSERDITLIKNSLIVLKKSLDLNKKIKNKFEEEKRTE
jgi:hypothetical protein